MESPPPAVLTEGVIPSRETPGGETPNEGGGVRGRHALAARAMIAEVW